MNRRHAGDEYGAKQMVKIVRTDLDARYDAGLAGRWPFAIEALMSAYDGDAVKTVANLEQAVALGHRDPLFFSNAIFDEVRNDPKFIEIESRALQALEIERRKALQMICFNNPAAGAWQTLPQTCEGKERWLRI